MQHSGFFLTQQTSFARAGPDAVCQAKAVVQHAIAIEGFDVPAARVLSYPSHLVAVLRSVCVNRHSPLARQRIGIAQQALGARKDEARRQRQANATFRSIVPIL